MTARVPDFESGAPPADLGAFAQSARTNCLAVRNGLPPTP